MTLSMPSKEDGHYILCMMRTSLIDFSYTHPWADELILSIDSPPPWLCDIAVEKYHGNQIEALQAFVYSGPFEAPPPDLEKFAVACLWLRYERRELSWATFLRMAGELLDSASADWDCETPYHYLNLYEDAYFTKEAEESTKQEYLKDHELKPWIDNATSRFKPFLERRRSDKFMDSQH